MDTSLLITALEYKAEAKNARMINGDRKKFEALAENVVATIEALAEVTPANPYVKVNGVYYDADKYTVPKNILVIINGFRIYVNTNSAFKNPVFMGSIESSGKVLEPAEFNAFFSRWNSNQYSEKLELVPVSLKVCTLMDVGAVCSESGLVIINDQAYLNEFAAFALNLHVPILNSENCDPDTFVSKMEVSEWLLSN